MRRDHYLLNEGVISLVDVVIDDAEVHHIHHHHHHNQSQSQQYSFLLIVLDSSMSIISTSASSVLTLESLFDEQEPDWVLIERVLTS